MVLHQDPKQNFIQHAKLRLQGLDVGTWMKIWCSILWNVWSARNNIIFNGSSFDYDRDMHNVMFFLLVVVI
uniref:Uncharacterized protein n=1 Tax=Cajanus cajan TaxID=3821 RepID=A0A151RC13_CAJCA|nr:hypothetical protein KK1_038595 [Cajanus cajan]